MVNLCLDTSVLIDLMRARKPQVRRRYAEAKNADGILNVSLISVLELEVGVRRSSRPAAEAQNVRQILSGVQVHPFDGADMRVAAKVAAELRPGGRLIGAYDVLIAGQALARGWTVVTGNIGEFSRVSGLTVIDWTVPVA